MDRIRVIEKTGTLEVDSDTDRTAHFIASDESVDRYGDVVMADGWDLKNYKRNPILLWMHDYTAPIGNATVTVEDGRLMARAKFAAKGLSAIADQCWALVKDKVLRAVSVGFQVEGADDYEPIIDKNGRQTGVRYLRQELLELSLVAVPANPNALSVARSLGLPADFIRHALPLDASVLEWQAARRRELQALRIAGVHASAPR
jgi:HK97 family phage prohead protease